MSTRGLFKELVLACSNGLEWLSDRDYPFNHVRGILTNVISILKSLDWKPIAFNKWVDNFGNTFWSNFSTAGIYLHAHLPHLPHDFKANQLWRNSVLTPLQELVHSATAQAATKTIAWRLRWAPHSRSTRNLHSPTKSDPRFRLFPCKWWIMIYHGRWCSIIIDYDGSCSIMMDHEGSDWFIMDLDGSCSFIIDLVGAWPILCYRMSHHVVH